MDSQRLLGGRSLLLCPSTLLAQVNSTCTILHTCQVVPRSFGIGSCGNDIEVIWHAFSVVDGLLSGQEWVTFEV